MNIEGLNIVHVHVLMYTQIYTLKRDEVPCAMTNVYSPEGGVLSVNKSFPSITA